MSNILDDLVTRADLDGLVRLIDATCASNDWQHLLEIRSACRAAVHSGRQLWPAATLAEYRLALRAPAECATQVLRGEASRFTLGPLTEVIAQQHEWCDLADFLAHEPQSTYVAYECALRGNTIANAETLFPALEIPVRCQPWEPQYQLAQYADNDATFDAPAIADTSTPQRCVTSVGALHDNHDITKAAHQLVEAWTTQSNGRCDTRTTIGDALGALGALGMTGVRLRELSADAAMSWLAWAAASGGAHGRRRGGATGRFSAWWMLAALGSALNSWPLSCERAQTIANEWTWWWWDADEPATGWQLQLVASNAAINISWAISARDAS